MSEYAQRLHACQEHIWGIYPPALDRLLAGTSPSAAAHRARPPGGSSGIGVLSILGPISHRASLFELFGGTSYQSIQFSLAKLDADPNVSTVILDIDSPGGTVAGATETAAAIRGMKTRTIAVANTVMASAAYYLASAADEIVVSPSAMIGSIGVVAMHVDFSEALAKEGVKVTYLSAGEGKVDGNTAEPLSDRARANWQAEIDTFYSMFVGDVMRGRNAAGQHLTHATIRSAWKADVYLATEAVEIGMADRVATLPDVIGQALRQPPRRRALPASRSRLAAEDERRLRRRRRLGV